MGGGKPQQRMDRRGKVQRKKQSGKADHNQEEVKMKGFRKSEVTQREGTQASEQPDRGRGDMAGSSAGCDLVVLLPCQDSAGPGMPCGHGR